MADIDREVGELKGKQDAMQRELGEIKTDLKGLTNKVDAQDITLARIEGKIDAQAAAAKATDKHPVTVTTRIEQDGAGPEGSAGVVVRVMNWRPLPWALAMIAILVMAMVCFAALTGRNASSFVPSHQPAPATPGTGTPQ